MRACELDGCLKDWSEEHTWPLCSLERGTDLRCGSLPSTDLWSSISEGVGRHPALCSAGGPSTTIGKPRPPRVLLRASGEPDCHSEAPGAALTALTGLWAEPVPEAKVKAAHPPGSSGLLWGQIPGFAPGSCSSLQRIWACSAQQCGQTQGEQDVFCPSLV